MKSSKKLYRLKVLIHIAISSFFFNGCGLNSHSVNIESIPIEIPKYWSTSIHSNDSLVGDWHSIFDEPEFEDFIILLKKNSIDLQTIVYDQKIAYYGSLIKQPRIFPSINSNAGLDTNMQNLAGFGFADSFLEDSDDSDNSGIINFGSTNVSFGINFQWEVDIWGNLLNARKASLKDYESINYNLNYLGFSLLVRASQIYFDAVEASMQLKLAEESYTSFVEISNFVKTRYEKGLKSSLDYRLSQATVSNSKIILENRKIQLKNINRKIETMLGLYPTGNFIKAYNLPNYLLDIDIGIPADLLLRRPDIKALFLNAESAGLRLAEAKRNRLPRISLSGNVGTSSNSLDDIFNIEHGVWNLGANLLTPIFNGSTLSNNIKLQKINKEKAKKDLISGLLKAFSEVEKILDYDNSLNVQIQAINLAVEESSDVLSLSKQRYDKGLLPLDFVLNSQASYNSIRSQKLSLTNKNIKNRLSLILAIGGEFIPIKKD